MSTETENKKSVFNKLLWQNPSQPNITATKKNKKKQKKTKTKKK